MPADKKCSSYISKIIACAQKACYLIFIIDLVKGAEKSLIVAHNKHVQYQWRIYIVKFWTCAPHLSVQFS